MNTHQPPYALPPGTKWVHAPVYCPCGNGVDGIGAEVPAELAVLHIRLLCEACGVATDWRYELATGALARVDAPEPDVVVGT